MTEVWLRPNLRILKLGGVSAFMLCVLAGATWFCASSGTVRATAFVLLLAGVAGGIGVVRKWLKPRIAYSAGKVLFHLSTTGPIAVPVQAVEAFFLGQGPAHLSQRENQRWRTITLVARLSRKEPQWAHQQVIASLATWCDGYVSIRGSWCEPLTEELIRRLNRRLGEVTKASQVEKNA